MSKTLDSEEGGIGGHLKAGLTDAAGTTLSRSCCHVAPCLVHSILTLLTPLILLLLLPIHSHTDTDIWIAGEGNWEWNFWSSRLKAWLCSSPWNSGHAEIFCAGRLGMVAEGDSAHSHGAWRDNQERDSWRRISFCFYALTILSICLQRCCLTQLPLSPRRKSFSGCVWAICWGWVGSHWCLSEGLCPSAGRRRAREANSDQCFDHSSALHLLLHLLHLHLVLLRSSHLDLGLRSNSLTPVVRGPEDISLRQMRRWMNTNRL